MRPRTALHILFLRVVLALLPVALLAVFAFSDRLAGWLPQSTIFVVVFLCTGVALIIWISVATGSWAAERAAYARLFTRLAAAVRVKRRRS